MNKITLALIDDNNEFCEITAAAIRDSYGAAIDVIGIAHNGEEGIRLINDKLPDMALIDHYMPMGNGFTVLKTVKGSNRTRDVTCLMICACAPHDFFVHEVSQAGAELIFVKPLDVHYFAANLVNLYRFKKGENVMTSPRGSPKTARASEVEDFADAVLRDNGFSTNVKGYFYLKKAICCCVDDTGCLDMLTKILYPKVAKIFGSSSARVERAMRHSITSAWARRPCAYPESDCLYAPDERPTVGAFLRTAVNAFIKKNEGN